MGKSTRGAGPRGRSSRRRRRWAVATAGAASLAAGMYAAAAGDPPASRRDPSGLALSSRGVGPGARKAEPGPPPTRQTATATPLPTWGEATATPLPTWGQATAERPAAPPSPPAARIDAPVRPATSAEPTIAVTASPPVVPPPPQVFPLDLTTALRLAEVENPQIAEARQRILEATALRRAAYALLLPTFNAGTNYHGHTGDLQRSSGRILSVSSQSLYFGGGARTLAAESLSFPAVNIASPLADALFEPLAARREVDRARFDATATANAVLLDVATLYFDLLGAEAGLALRRETEAEAREAARLTAAYARSGQGYRSDADRAATLLALIHREVERGEEEVAVASARLSRRLHLDPVVRLQPLAAVVEPMVLVDPDSPTAELVQAALRGRPEIGARAAAIGTAEARLRREVARPWLPTVWVGFSGGAFGGGSNLVSPMLGDFAGRTDYDVRAFWTLENLGLGNLQRQGRQRALVGQAIGEQSRTIAAIRREVASARAEAIAARERVEATRFQLATAQAGFREDLDRLRNTVGRPIELTNNLELLAQARLDHLRAILDENRAQLALFVSLGSPPPLDRPATEPLPAAPIASPPLPPPAVR